VFVSVKDAKPKRKVAVPIGDGSSWDQFCSQVRLVGAAPGWGGCGQRVRLSFAAAGRAQGWPAVPDRLPSDALAMPIIIWYVCFAVALLALPLLITCRPWLLNTNL
jgi:hypothetical protein